MVFLRCPRFKFVGVSICLSIEPHASYLHHIYNIYAEKRKASPFFVFLSRTSFSRLRVFPGSLYRSYLSNKEKGDCFPYVGFGMINTVSKIRIQMGMDNQPIWQHLRWPSSWRVGEFTSSMVPKLRPKDWLVVRFFFCSHTYISDIRTR